MTVLHHNYRSWPTLLAALLLAAWPAMATANGPRALVIPSLETTLASPMGAVVREMTLDAGDGFTQGQVLVRLACDIETAELRKAEAERQVAERTLASHRKLAELRSISTLEVAVAAAQAERAAAHVELMTARLSRCTISAPFDGVVVQRHAQPHQYVNQGQPLLEVLAHDAPQIQVLAPSQWLRWITPGTRFSVAVDELGITTPARVTRVGPRVDPVSQTVPLRGAFLAPPAALKPGMSGVTHFTPPGPMTP